MGRRPLGSADSMAQEKSKVAGIDEICFSARWKGLSGGAGGRSNKNNPGDVSFVRLRKWWS